MVHFQKTILLLTALVLLALPLSAQAEAALRLPVDTKVIGVEAFSGVKAVEAVLPEGVREIGARAFADSAITAINLPDSLESIAPDAFDGCEDLVATVSADGPALRWCRENGVSYRIVGAAPEVYAVDGVREEYLPGEALELSVLTGLDADRVVLLDEQGAELLRVEAPDREDQFGRYWTLSFTPDAVGAQTCVVCAGGEAGTGAGVVCSFTVSEAGRLIRDAWVDWEWDIPFSVGEEVPFRLQLDKVEDWDAGEIYLPDVLRLVDADDDSVLAVWEGVSDELDQGEFDNDYEYWLGYAFAEPGEKRVYFQASIDGTTFDAGSEALTVRIVEGARVSNAALARGAQKGVVGDPVWFFLNMTRNTQEIGLFDESGALLKTWTEGEAMANSADDGYAGEDEEDYGDGEEGGEEEDGDHPFSDGVATLSWTFTAPGAQRVTFKASPDGSDWSDEGLTMAVVVGEEPVIYSAGYAGWEAHWEAFTGVNTIGLETSTGARYVRLYDENGATLGTWGYDEAASDEGDVLSWSLEHEFTEPGFAGLTLRASADGVHYGDGWTTYVRIRDLPEITGFENDCGSGSFSGMQPGETVTFTVETSGPVTRVELLDGAGKLLAAAEEGDENAWTLQYAFDAVGDIVVYARATLDGVHYCKPVSAVITTHLSSGQQPFADPIVSGCSGVLEAVGDTVRFNVFLEEERAGEALDLRITELGSGAVTVLPVADLLSEGDGTTCAVEYTFADPGEHWLKIDASADGALYDAGVLQRFCVYGGDLSALSGFRFAERQLGVLRWTRAARYPEYDYYSAVERQPDSAALTPASLPDAILLFGDLADDYLTEVQLSGETEYTLFGLTPGMRRDEVMQACLENGLTPINPVQGRSSLGEPTLGWDPDAELWVFLDPTAERPFDVVYVIFEGDTAARIVATNQLEV